MIWVENGGSGVTLNANVTIGSPTNPVILVINDSVDISGNVTIYGIVYIADGAVFGSGNNTIYGSVISYGEADLSTAVTGNSHFIYSGDIVNRIQKNGSYDSVEYSWNDLGY